MCETAVIFSTIIIIIDSLELLFFIYISCGNDQLEKGEEREKKKAYQSKKRSMLDDI